MIRAFAIGLVVSVIWSLIQAGTYVQEPVAPELVTRALLVGVVGVFLFYVLSYVRGSRYIAISITVLLTLVFCHVFLIPVLDTIISSIIYEQPKMIFENLGHVLFDEIDKIYWSFRLQDPFPLSLFLPSPDLLIVALAVTALVLTGGRRSEVAMGGGSSFSAESGFAGGTRRQDWSEINRLMLAHAYTSGSRFRRSVIDRARESFNAPALEVGIDMERLLRLCLDLESKYRAVLVLLVIGVVMGLTVFAATEEPVVFIAVLVLAAIINGLWRTNLYSTAYRQFGPGHFDESTNVPAAGLADDQTHGLPPSGQNVVVYSGFTPFDFAGLPLGGWSVAIDTSRAASDITASGKTKPFTEGELRSLMSEELRKSKIEGLSVRDLVVAHGTDAPVLPAAREYKGVKQPRVVLDAEEMDALPGEIPNTLRRYLWISVRDWGGDLTVSAFWRCSLRKRMLHVELSRFVLTPIAQSHRDIDHVREDWRYHAGQFIAGGILSPVALISALLTLLVQMRSGLARALGSEKRSRAKAIKLNPRYNFGAPQSLRVQLMGDEFLHYFQKMDQQYYEKTVDKILLESLFDFLEDHGIDTADLKESQTAIFNSGVIVQGGDITAQSLAVGEKAKAKTNVVNRAVRKGATAITGSRTA